MEKIDSAIIKCQCHPGTLQGFPHFAVFCFLKEAAVPHLSETFLRGELLLKFWTGWIWILLHTAAELGHYSTYSCAKGPHPPGLGGLSSTATPGVPQWWLFIEPSALDHLTIGTSTSNWTNVRAKGNLERTRAEVAVSRQGLSEPYGNCLG